MRTGAKKRPREWNLVQVDVSLLSLAHTLPRSVLRGGATEADAPGFCRRKYSKRRVKVATNTLLALLFLLGVCLWALFFVFGPKLFFFFGRMEERCRSGRQATPSRPADRTTCP